MYVATGFREYPREIPNKEWTYDVDAGTIIAGFSQSANSFGMAAAKINRVFRLLRPFFVGNAQLNSPDAGGLGSRRWSPAVRLQP